MKKLLLPVLAVFLLNNAVAQVESIGPITQMFVGNTAPKAVRASNPIDSSFVYVTDTLDLPFFDEFSRSKFQAYDAQPGDANVTEQLFWQLLDPADDTPLPATAQYSTEQTYRYERFAGETDTIALPSVQVKIGDFSEYPVVYATTTVYPAYNIYDTLDFVNDIDTIFVSDPVVQDSALIFTAVLNDPGAVWLDHYVYHNYTYAVNPWSLGVATFDGLDETGYPYNFGSTSSGVADFLTSKPLDLSVVSPADSIYLSFLVQSKGYGDEPEASDSLVLEFYDANADQWNMVWSRTGSPLSDWEVGHIPVTQAPYFTDAFQFRFKNYGGLSGSLDHFHLDYVHLRTFAGYQDSVFKDFAWSYPPGTLIEDYTQVPWDHWRNSPNGHMTDSFKVVVRSTYTIANNENDGVINVSQGGTPEGSFTLIGDVLNGPDDNYLPFSTTVSYHDFSAGYQFDPTIPGDEAVFDIVGHASAQQPDVFTQNDSCFGQQVFRDVYAYDDGTAEAAYGTTGAQSRLAYKFTPYESDSLIGVQMHFVPSVVDVSNNQFLLTVWDDNNGIPGTIIYEDDIFYPRQPQYEEGYNGFTTYWLADTMRLPINGTFYIGWRQFDSPRLNIGFDWNNPNADKIFFSLNGHTWPNTTYNGSIMMRPVFSTSVNADLAVDEQQMQPEWEVYPNPTNGSVSVRWNNDQPFPGAQCFDAQGRVIGATGELQQSMDLGNAPAGIYFVRLNGFSTVKKVIRY